MPPDSPPQTPRIHRSWQAAFQRFAGYYVRRHFHSLSVNRQSLLGLESGEQAALVVFANHASWWDPLTALVIADRLFPRHCLYAPMEAAALAKYGMLSRLGFFPVDTARARGARDFLDTSRALLSVPGNSIWVTPQGRFADVRDLQAEFRPGLAHLAANVVRASQASAAAPSTPVWFIAAAVEYVFWEERQPELLVWFAPPMFCDFQTASREMSQPMSKQAWNQRLQSQMHDAQQALAAASVARDIEQFEVLLGGSAGTFWAYDMWRRMRGWMRGHPVDLAHGDKLRLPHGR